MSRRPARRPMAVAPSRRAGPRLAPRGRAAAGAAAGAATVLAVGALLAGCTSGTEPQPPASPDPAPTSTALRSDDIRRAPVDRVFPGGLAVQTDSVASRASSQLVRSGDTAGAAAADDIAERPVALWLGDGWTDAELRAEIAEYLADARAQGGTAVFVTYAIPERDCGHHSRGGLPADRYAAWSAVVADALAGEPAVVVVEPDSLAMLDTCPDQADVRLPLLREAVEGFAAAGVPAYLDGGNSDWVPPAVMAERLRAAGVEHARGFSTNVSGFHPTDSERDYAGRLSALTGGAHYVVDVSRNGRGWQGTWCNPEGVALGQDPRVADGDEDLDALLWVKTPGLSDGDCNDGPGAGRWFASYAVDLVERRDADRG
ncbi:glycoside hydrolase family 6 protein [Frigoribacterium salinisoli]